MNEALVSSNHSDKRFLKVLNGQTTDRPPFWFMRQAGRYLPEYRKLRSATPNFLEFCYSPDLTVEAALQPLRRFQPDAAILFSDILVVPDALGQSVRFEEGIGPVLEPIRSASGLDRLRADEALDRLEPVFTSVRRLSSALPDGTALIGFAGAPWTVAYYMVEGRSGKEGATVRHWAYQDPDGFQKLIDLLVDITTAYLIKQVENGAEVLQLFDSWSGLLSSSQFERWVIEPTAKIVTGVKAVHPGTPIIGFPRNAGANCVSYIQKTGVDGISLDSSMPLSWARENLQSHCTVQGNLDNVVLKTGGSLMERETNDILTAFSGGPFVFNLGHGILPETPPENVERVSEIVRRYSHP
ncbi:MAG: uroporphyrinogen decarboxylase [Rhodospirillales bacterium]